MLFDKVRPRVFRSGIYQQKISLVDVSSMTEFFFFPHCQFDPEGFGEIPVEDFLAALKSPEWKAEIPPNKRDILLTRAKESRVQAVTFQDFVNVVSECMRISIKFSQREVRMSRCF